MMDRSSHLTLGAQSLLERALSILPRNRYPELDGLRGIAIVLVVLFHCRTIAKPVSPLQIAFIKVLEAGWVGVDLFFVLSGFLITGILLQTVGRPRYFKNFYVRRTLRIFPLYYGFLSLILVAAVLGVVAMTRAEQLRQVWYWAYLQNWLPLRGEEPLKLMGHFWSLAVEEQFYLAWPLLIMGATRYQSRISLCLVTILGAFLARWWLVGHGQTGAYFLTICRADALGCGAAVATLMHEGRRATDLARPARWLGGACLFVVFGVALAGRGFYGQAPLVLRYGLLPLAVSFASLLIIARSASANAFLGRFLRAPSLRLLGGLSYAIYVFHYPLSVLLRRVWPRIGGFWGRELGFIIAVGAGSTLLAWLSYRWLEGPLLKLKDRWAPLNVAPAASQTSTSNASLA